MGEDKFTRERFPLQGLEDLRESVEFTAQLYKLLLEGDFAGAKRFICGDINKNPLPVTREEEFEIMNNAVGMIRMAEYDDELWNEILEKLKERVKRNMVELSRRQN